MVTPDTATNKGIVGLINSLSSLREAGKNPNTPRMQRF